jgi:inosine-uridine nucleoside N-ribohydrolase
MSAGISFAVLSLALPIHVWRTGEPPALPIPIEPGQRFAAFPLRLWIDTDAACGTGSATDADDCLALLLLAEEPRMDIAGVSTVFGNASLEETDGITRALVQALNAERQRPVLVHQGSPDRLPGKATTPVRGASVTAVTMLRRALAQGPLTILALGPLTNVAAALHERPDLRANVVKIVAVMGRRKGHVFHPIEGATARSLLGHGPIFRDFNFTKDEEAAGRVMAMGLPLSLVPYEAARAIKLKPTDLDRMEARGGAAAWVARRAKPWMAYWQEGIGLEGFYPFDLVAAAYVVEPSLLRCAPVQAAVDDDTWLFGWLGYRGLFVAPQYSSEIRSSVAAPVLYCPQVSVSLGPWLTARLAGVPSAQALYVRSSP